MQIFQNSRYMNDLKKSIDDLHNHNITPIGNIDVYIKELKESSTGLNIQTRNDTEYLLSNPHNAKRIMQSIENIENNKDKLIHKSLEGLGID